MSEAEAAAIYTDVGSVDDFEEAVSRRVSVDGEPVAIVRFRHRFFAFSNRCPHREGPMHFGYVTEADEVVCPFHFAVFDLATGLALEGPYGIKDLPVYAVRVEEGAVLVYTGVVS